MRLRAGREETEAMTLPSGQKVSTEKPRAMTWLQHMCSVSVPEKLERCRDFSRGACHGVMDLRNARMCFAPASDDGFSSCNPSSSLCAEPSRQVQVELRKAKQAQLAA